MSNAPHADDNLQNVENLLNKPGADLFVRKRSRLSGFGGEFGPNWKDIPMNTRRNKRSGVRRFFCIALIFFLAAAGVASYLFIDGTNLVTGDNIEIIINGPIAIKGGEIASFEILLVNNNPTALELADLIVTFPDGTRTWNDVSKTLTRYRKVVGAIAPNQTVSESIKAIFYAKENSEKELLVGLEYRTQGSNAIFAKEQKFAYRIVSAPVNISVTAPSDANSGQEITLTVKALSNTSELLPALLTQIDYPPGFTLVKAEPAPLVGTKNVWRLGDLAAQAERSISVRGVILGEDEETKAFLVTMGAGGENDTEHKIIVPYNSVSQTLTIKRPFVGLTLFLGGSDEETFIAEGADILNGSLEWINNLPARVMDGQLRVRFSGAVLDERSVLSQNGFFRSSDRTLLWDKSTLPALENIEAGEKGEVNFSFASLPLFTSEQIRRNPELGLEVIFTGTRLADVSGSGGRIETVLQRNIKFNSVTQLVSRAVHYSGPLLNTGSLPPKVGQETSYTVIWSLLNSSNDVLNARVEASLPSYMRFMGNATPKEEVVSYDSRTGKVSWALGTLKAGAGLTSALREVAFQIALTPSSSQAELIVPLMGEAAFSGTDDFTKRPRATTRSAITTEISTDPKSKEGEYRVIR